jgi:hypothetical protein
MSRAGCPNVSFVARFIAPHLDIPLVYRVHWLRAKAKLDRATEQAILLPYEMDWTIACFNYRAEQWLERQASALANNLPGHVCYAARQVDMWKRFRDTAQDEFSKARHVVF